MRKIGYGNEDRTTGEEGLTCLAYMQQGGMRMELWSDKLGKNSDPSPRRGKHL